MRKADKQQESQLPLSHNVPPHYSLIHQDFTVWDTAKPFMAKLAQISTNIQFPKGRKRLPLCTTTLHHQDLA